MNFICTVSPGFPENYQIGLQAGLWGVQEKYAPRIARAGPGDLLFFVISGEVRSVHKIESDPFIDRTPLWPPKDGDLFHWRIRISEPTHVGPVSLGDLSKQISFLRGLDRWTGALQGPNGVFNNRLTEDDAALIMRHMQPAPGIVRYDQKRKRREAVADLETEPTIVLRPEQLRAEILRNLHPLGWDESPAAMDAVSRAVTSSGSVISLVAENVRKEVLVVDLHVSRPLPDSFLELLRKMAVLRASCRYADILGTITCNEDDPELRSVAQLVPNTRFALYTPRLQFTGALG
jgi:hypothetical protein